MKVSLKRVDGTLKMGSLIILVAAGRSLNMDVCDWGTLGIEVTDRKVATNSFMQTAFECLRDWRSWGKVCWRIPLSGKGRSRLSYSGMKMDVQLEMDYKAVSGDRECGVSEEGAG